MPEQEDGREEDQANITLPAASSGAGNGRPSSGSSGGETKRRSGAVRMKQLAASSMSRGLPAHEKRRQRSNQFSMFIYAASSLLFICLFLFSGGGGGRSSGERGRGSAERGGGGRDSGGLTNTEGERLWPPHFRGTVNRTGAAVELLKLQQSRKQKLQDRILRYRVIAAHAHDSNAFTQGLEFLAGRFIESTGIKSSLREVEIRTGQVLRKHRLQEAHFGEGCTVFKGRVYQLTWQTHTCFVYDLDTFQVVEKLEYTQEGWGLTHDDTHLIMSDGTSTLYFRDPQTFQVTRTVNVVDPTTGQAVAALNELEFVHGEIFANIWFTDRIARISPHNGHVVGWIDLSGLHTNRSPAARGEDVLNGIAYDTDRDRLWVTGKLWPTLFEIELV